ncbi:competence type IV pilus assembly protein ComGB [Psychrobacillus sp.]|uniref:competence type IV pilus assembly protein ComGB n=1 Tax=Psychrobacillus sp. TaxID=1871623 RepID=UPI0028BE5380|nr:competence type IV pilus assembly protein ComGB [Psychrobacillus sp.]
MLFQKIKHYFTRKEETIPLAIQASFLKRQSELLKEGYTFHESVVMLLPFHVKNPDLVAHKVIEVHKNGLSVTEVFKVLGFPNRILLPISLATIHGQLQETLEILSVQVGIFERARKKLNNLLMYPLFLFVVIFLLFSIFRIYFLPNMQSLLDTRSQAESSASIVWTGILLQLPNYSLIALVLLVLAIFTLLFFVRKKSVAVQLSFYEKLPIVHAWYRLFLTRTFTREIGSLIESGMSLQQAFDALMKQEEHKILQFIAGQMKDKIVHGESFSSAVLLLPYFTADFHHFVIHGENSGHLGRELTLYSEFLSERLEAKITRYLGIIQPVLFLILAVFIVGAYLAILLPIYEMINIT